MLKVCFKKDQHSIAMQIKTQWERDAQYIQSNIIKKNSEEKRRGIYKKRKKKEYEIAY